ncbi:hypothetical protein, partial [Nocardia sp. AB354]|uniref:hypothetical protein n=1 Tax=Nocardia sp. AB354 TaxID=3413283 RepID=UPI003C1B98A7
HRAPHRGSDQKAAVLPAQAREWPRWLSRLSVGERRSMIGESHIPAAVDYGAGKRVVGVQQRLQGSQDVQ